MALDDGSRHISAPWWYVNFVSSDRQYADILCLPAILLLRLHAWFGSERKIRYALIGGFVLVHSITFSFALFFSFRMQSKASTNDSIFFASLKLCIAGVVITYPVFPSRQICTTRHYPGISVLFWLPILLHELFLFTLAAYQIYQHFRLCGFTWTGITYLLFRDSALLFLV